MQNDGSLRIENAQVERPGMQIDAAAELVLSVVEAHACLLWRWAEAQARKAVAEHALG